MGALKSVLVCSIVALFCVLLPVPKAYAVDVAPSLPSSYVAGTNYYMWQVSGTTWDYIELSSGASHVIFEDNSGSHDTLAISSVTNSFVSGSKWEYDGTNWVALSGNNNVDIPVYATFKDSVKSNLPCIYQSTVTPVLESHYLPQFNYTDLTYPINSGDVLAPAYVAPADSNAPVVLLTSSVLADVPAKIVNEIPVAVTAGLGVLALLMGIRLARPLFKKFAR